MNDDRGTNPSRRRRLLAGIAGTGAAAVAILFLVYALTAPLSPEQAAESYIEDHYDAVAEALVHSAFPDHPLKAEIIAEVSESVAEQLVPYRCQVTSDDGATVDTRCDLSFSLGWPLELQIYAPFRVTLLTTEQDFFGRPTPLVQNANLIVNEASINGLSLAVLTGAEAKVQEIKETFDNLGSKFLSLPTENSPEAKPIETPTTIRVATPDLTKQPPPTALPKEISESGICGRSPEMQHILIKMLGIPSLRWTRKVGQVAK